ncbi:nuclear pore complex protein NUP43 [Andrographis paniculata]|uniref:nuclear pore complex protein NUP43 n=1 Tax=Andrographis paniculata TaxID=175694 RepID=UPI0021E96795|nr:nuclear pore complex protein NUP43 [Andrographis paniculata]
MAVTTSDQSPRVHKLPQHTYIDALRWLPHVSTFSRHILFATYDSDASSPSLQTLTFSSSQIGPSLAPQVSISAPSRITSLKVSPSPFSPAKPIAAAATFSGSALFYSADLINGSLNLEFAVPETGFHTGPVSGIDLSDSGSECVSVGEDGRVNLVNLTKKGFRRVFESNGLVSYTSVRWASPVEFVTGAFGFGLHWWDQRKPGGPVALFKENWTGGATSGVVHSIDIHQSRKHTCLAGGSSGTLFAWDIRSPKQSVVLSGVGFRDAPKNSLVESDVWEVQYDNYTHSSKIINSSSSSRILPAMICSEDGILGVVEHGEEPVELMAEPCAINSFDIDRQNPSDVICSLEWESVAILTRP